MDSECGRENGNRSCAAWKESIQGADPGEGLSEEGKNVGRFDNPFNLGNDGMRYDKKIVSGPPGIYDHCMAAGF